MQPDRESSTQRPTLMDLQRKQLEALVSGDEDRAAECQKAIFRRVEQAQAEARVSSAA
jgi:hypothetical protein